MKGQECGKRKLSITLNIQNEEWLRKHFINLSGAIDQILTVVRTNLAFQRVIFDSSNQFINLSGGEF